MNFTPFGTTFSGTIPTLTTAKFAHQVSSGAGQVVGLLSADEVSGVTYLRPVDANSFTLNLASQQGSGNNDNGPQIITLPISVPPSKPGELPQQQTLQIQVVNPGGDSGGGDEKFHAVPISLQPFQHGGTTVLTVAYSNPHQDQGDPLQLQLQASDVEQVEQGSQSDNNNTNNTSSNNNGDAASQNAIHSEELVLPDGKSISEDGQDANSQAYPVAVVTHIPHDIILREETITGDKEEDSNKEKPIIEKREVPDEAYNGGGSNVPAGWQPLTVTSTTVADYLSRLPSSSLPLSLHHFLKFSAETIKREAAIESSPLGPDPDGNHAEEGEEQPSSQPLIEDSKTGKKKKKYKKKPPKPRRPRPGQVHIAVALDGTTLYCCPECNMAYPDKEMLEQHLVAHKIERRFICDICGAGLKRKEHLERHKLGHNPERPYICSVCCKGFKRKEHLNLHFVIHSGEKSEVCPECGKGFHRKDHLRKHARSHIAKKIKEETLVVQTGPVEDHLSEASSLQVPTSENSPTPIILQQATPQSPSPITLHQAQPHSPTPITLHQAQPHSPTPIILHPAQSH